MADYADDSDGAESAVLLDPRCSICRRTKKEHEGLRHAFSLNGELKKAEIEVDKSSHPSNPRPQGSVRKAVSGDPVLRLALIRAGVITVEDLVKVEGELEASGISVADPLV